MDDKDREILNQKEEIMIIRLQNFQITIKI